MAEKKESESYKKEIVTPIDRRPDRNEGGKKFKISKRILARIRLKKHVIRLRKIHTKSANFRF